MNQILRNMENNNKQNYGSNPKKTRKKRVFFIYFTLVISLILVLTYKITDVMAMNSKEDNEIENILLEEIMIPTVEVIGNEITSSSNTIISEIPTAIEDLTPKTQDYVASNGKTYDSIGILSIPSLGIEYQILSTTSDELLDISLNKYWGANPNQVGNMVVVGHNYKSGKFFGKLRQIKIGAIVKITDLTGKTLDYTVYETDIIDPYDNSCTSQLTNGKTEITLITCFNSGTQRFIAKARADV